MTRDTVPSTAGGRDLLSSSADVDSRRFENGDARLLTRSLRAGLAVGATRRGSGGRATRATLGARIRAPRPSTSPLPTQSGYRELLPGVGEDEFDFERQVREVEPRHLHPGFIPIEQGDGRTVHEDVTCARISVDSALPADKHRLPALTHHLYGLSRHRREIAHGERVFLHPTRSCRKRLQARVLPIQAAAVRARCERAVVELCRMTFERELEFGSVMRILLVRVRRGRVLGWVCKPEGAGSSPARSISKALQMGILR